MGVVAGSCSRRTGHMMIILHLSSIRIKWIEHFSTRLSPIHCGPTLTRMGLTNMKTHLQHSK